MLSPKHCNTTYSDISFLYLLLIFSVLSFHIVTPTYPHFSFYLFTFLCLQPLVFCIYIFIPTPNLKFLYFTLWFHAFYNSCLYFSTFILSFRQFFFLLYIEPPGAALTKAFLFFLFSQLPCD